MTNQIAATEVGRGQAPLAEVNVLSPQLAETLSRFAEALKTKNLFDLVAMINDQTTLLAAVLKHDETGMDMEVPAAHLIHIRRLVRTEFNRQLEYEFRKLAVEFDQMNCFDLGVLLEDEAKLTDFLAKRNLIVGDQRFDSFTSDKVVKILSGELYFRLQKIAEKERQLQTQGQSVLDGDDATVWGGTIEEKLMKRYRLTLLLAQEALRLLTKPTIEDSKAQ